MLEDQVLADDRAWHADVPRPLPGPGQDNQNFYVFDYCGNLKHFSKPLPESPGSLQKSLNQKLFETRLGLITAADPAEGQGTETDRGLSVDVCNVPGRDQVRRRPDPVHHLIVTELTANGVVEPSRLYESPYIDHAPTGPDDVFVDADVDNIVQILNTVKGKRHPGRRSCVVNFATMPHTL